MSADGYIGVEAFYLEEDMPDPCYGPGYLGVAERSVFRARVDLVMDEAGVDRFLDAMEAAIPGFARHGRRRPEPARCLPGTTRTLPSGPLEAEFVDD